MARVGGLHAESLREQLSDTVKGKSVSRFYEGVV
ncbi:hypothetical protein PLUA15_40082 [Pseudomonas lundensis]|uniref:Uncharacterized protein n=1 Tax=Pseudomonas lundensis TaxID=86185 RepID=A0AAX2H9M5_9PSED|nr:hypothetical protein PLUA15_40082 [Pseudomonas lundensis]